MSQADRTFAFGGSGSDRGQQQQTGYGGQQQGYGQDTGGGNPGAYAQMGSSQGDYQTGYQAGYTTGYQAGYSAAYSGAYSGAGGGGSGADVGSGGRGDVTAVSGEEGSDFPGESRGGARPHDVREIPVQEGPLDPGAGDT